MDRGSPPQQKVNHGPRPSAAGDVAWASARCDCSVAEPPPLRDRGLWAGRHEAEGDGAEQRARRAARRQMNADAGEMLDHARADLDQSFPDGNRGCRKNSPDRSPKRISTYAGCARRAINSCLAK